MYIDGILLILTGVCVYTDLRFRRIYNMLVLPVYMAALAIHLIQSGWGGFIIWSKGTVLGLSVLFIPFLLGGMGAGDVKLMGAIGALKGAAFALHVFLAAAVLGGIIAAALIITQAGFQKGWRNLEFFKDSIISISIPYALPIGLGTILTYWVM